MNRKSTDSQRKWQVGLGLLLAGCTLPYGCSRAFNSVTPPSVDANKTAQVDEKAARPAGTSSLFSTIQIGPRAKNVRDPFLDSQKPESHGFAEQAEGLASLSSNTRRPTTAAGMAEASRPNSPGEQFREESNRYLAQSDVPGFATVRRNRPTPHTTVPAKGDHQTAAVATFHPTSPPNETSATSGRFYGPTIRAAENDQLGAGEVVANQTAELRNPRATGSRSAEGNRPFSLSTTAEVSNSDSHDGTPNPAEANSSNSVANAAVSHAFRVPDNNEIRRASQHADHDPDASSPARLPSLATIARGESRSSKLPGSEARERVETLLAIARAEFQLGLKRDAYQTARSADLAAREAELTFAPHEENPAQVAIRYHRSLMESKLATTSSPSKTAAPSNSSRPSRAAGDFDGNRAELPSALTENTVSSNGRSPAFDPAGRTASTSNSNHHEAFRVVDEWSPSPSNDTVALNSPRDSASAGGPRIIAGKVRPKKANPFRRITPADADSDAGLQSPGRFSQPTSRDDEARTQTASPANRLPSTKPEWIKSEKRRPLADSLFAESSTMPGQSELSAKKTSSPFPVDELQRTDRASSDSHVTEHRQGLASDQFPVIRAGLPGSGNSRRSGEWHASTEFSRPEAGPGTVVARAGEVGKTSQRPLVFVNHSSSGPNRPASLAAVDSLESVSPLSTVPTETDLAEAGGSAGTPQDHETAAPLTVLTVPGDRTSRIAPSAAGAPPRPLNVDPAANPAPIASREVGVESTHSATAVIPPARSFKKWPLLLTVITIVTMIGASGIAMVHSRRRTSGAIS